MGATSQQLSHAARAERYAHDVVTGKIQVCKWIRLACQRQIDDRARKGWKYKFRPALADKICKFIEFLPHIKGRWKSRTIKLEDWQLFFLTTIFGWVDKRTGFRRFRKALIVVPRKNAKTTIAAGVGLYLLALDGEPGAEVYSAATTRDQAKISWDIAKRMVERTPGFRDRFGVGALAHSITIESKAAFFKPLSRDADTLEGLNIHGAIIDELHAHKTREVFDVLDEATGSRQQPLIFIISTEGDSADGIFAEQVNYGQNVLEGLHQDDTFFSVIYTIDPEDDWTAPASWWKANPNLGVSVLEKDIEIRCGQAQKNAGAQSSFLTKRLNIRVGASDAYFNMLAWGQTCKDETLKIEDFYGQECMVGLDLASKIDIAARVRLFRKGGMYYVFPTCYLPEDQLERGNPNYDLYRGWATLGILKLTPGNVIDFELIEQDLLQDRKDFKLLSVCYDPNQATEMSTRMQKEGLEMVDVPQNRGRLSEPMKKLEALIIAGKIRHDGNPAMSWMMGNVAAKVDAKDDVFPMKARAVNKIDAPVATMIALSHWMRREEVIDPYSHGARLMVV